MGQGDALKLGRRQLLVAGAMGLAGGVAGCDAPPPMLQGGFTDAAHERGHWLRQPLPQASTAPAAIRRTQVLILGGGVAGLAAARRLQQGGVEDFALLDLEDEPGGNSRAASIQGIACPLGAHYLPTPPDGNQVLLGFLEQIGLCRRVAGRWVYDERHLCHSPQERLFFQGHWQEGLLPVSGVSQATLRQYRQFAQQVQASRQGAGFAIPAASAAMDAAAQALDALSMQAWLDQQGLMDPHLRWYLDYCCRDDFGAGAAQVSAWAGLHYFASRHGFHAPGDDAPADRDGQDGVLTWPEGNAWLTRRLAAPLQHRLHTGSVVLRVSEERHAVSVDLWNAAEQRTERWSAPQVVLAVPLFIALRLLAVPPAALTEAAALMRHAPWLVANLLLEQPLVDGGGAAPAWDNVLYSPDHARGREPQRGAPPARFALGYVDAMHQSTRPHPGPTVLTAYWALGGDLPEQGPAQRARLLSEPWSAWAQAVLLNLAPAHPDLPDKVKQVDLMRYGHAMSVPLPGVRSSAALAELARGAGRVHFAHSDLAAYSVFEEAFFHGHAAAWRVLRGDRVTPASTARSRSHPSAPRG